MKNVGKGSRNELAVRRIYERAGYWVYSPENARYGDNDLWNLFDLAAFRVTDYRLRFVQVKTNAAAGVRAWSHRAKRFERIGARVGVQMVVKYDGEGYRLIRCKPIDEPAPSDGYKTVYDERDDERVAGHGHTEMNLGDGLAEYLKP